MKVQAYGLFAAAERLRAAAARLVTGGQSVHPPLAMDQTSVAAATRLTAAAVLLQSVTNSQAAELISTADHLAAMAVLFTEQETRNAAVVETLVSATQSAGSPRPLDPLSPVPTGLPLPLPVHTGADAEAVARQLYAGNASAGTYFVQNWRSRSAAAAGVCEVVRATLPEVADAWNSPAGNAAATLRLMAHTYQVAMLADRAAALADRAASHAGHYRAAVAGTPAPAAYEAVRGQLRHAVEANARVPGRFTPLVSALIARQGGLRQQGFNAQTQYHEDTETDWRQLLSAFGAAAGGAVAAAFQLPAVLMQTGQQLAQSAVQGMSGLAASPASGIDSATTESESAVGRFGFTADDRPGVGPTSPSGAMDSAPVSPTSSAAPSTTPVAHSSSSRSTAPAGGFAGVPMGLPMGMLGQPLTTDAAKQVAADKKLVVPALPHGESVTGRGSPGRLARRLVAVHAGQGEAS